MISLTHGNTERVEKESRNHSQLSIDEEEDGVRLGDTVLAMTRALGHSLLSSTPDMVSVHLKPQHQVLVLASDGVWDHVDDEDVIKIALESEEPEAAARDIVEFAMSLNRDCRDQDNATAVVIYFDLDQD